MDYAKLLNRAFNIVWDHKFLIILGVLVALGGGTPGNQVSWQVDEENNGDFDFDFGTLPGMDDETFRLIVIPAIVSLIGILLVIALAVWAISLIARGGLIASVNTIEIGGTSSFSLAWGEGWQRARRLIGIGLVPAIPILVMLGAGLVGAGFFAGLFAILGSNFELPVAAGIGSLALIALCIAAPLAFGLSLLRIFAERACMLEGLGVFDSYRRGWEVAMANLANAILLFVTLPCNKLQGLLVIYLAGPRPKGGMD